MADVIAEAGRRGRAVVSGRGHAVMPPGGPDRAMETTAAAMPAIGMQMLGELQRAHWSELAAKDQLIEELRRRAEVAEAALAKRAETIPETIPSSGAIGLLERLRYILRGR